MNQMILSMSDIICRLKQACSLKTDAECARFFGIHPSTLANWKTRNTIRYTVIVQKCGERGLNLHYILTGEGEPIFHTLRTYEKSQSKGLKPLVK
jgi:hypothetical protein